MRSLYAIILCFFMSVTVSGQTDSLVNKNDSTSGRVYLLQKVERNGETLPEVDIKEVSVVPHTRNYERKAYSILRRNERLISNLKIVYPYALIVRYKLSEVNADLALMTNEKERRKYIKDFEKTIFNQYEGQISDMTVTQGRLLIKLIDRETQNTSFDLIRQYRGGLNAAFWQGIARIFGTNLKEGYDPYGEDAMIEAIVQDIEEGRL